MWKKIQVLSALKYYWLILLTIGIVLESTALIYQYLLDYYPCVLCIHVRIIVLGIIIISLLALNLQRFSKIIISLHLVMFALLLLLLERSYNLLGVERGFVSGDCSMNSGLPTWFAIDQWFPWMFKIWEPCGYTPELIFSVTMAEALLVLSITLLLFSFIAIWVSIKHYQGKV